MSIKSKVANAVGKAVSSKIGTGFDGIDKHIESGAKNLANDYIENPTKIVEAFASGGTTTVKDFAVEVGKDVVTNQKPSPEADMDMSDGMTLSPAEKLNKEKEVSIEGPSPQKGLNGPQYENDLNGPQYNYGLNAPGNPLLNQDNNLIQSPAEKMGLMNSEQIQLQERQMNTPSYDNNDPEMSAGMK